ncbi:MAG: FAD-binding oxidoreductase [Actinobacteria bacterium]|nr:FAD-binding oxidoreductase [Actinomycetota bacterium]
MLPDALRRELVDAVGPEHVLLDDDVTAGYRVDWTGRFRGRTAAVVRPADTAQVAAVLQACSAASMPVVPQGGNTGLVGGGVPGAGEVVLSLRRLDTIGPVDRRAGQVTVGAGVTLAATQRAATDSGLAFGVDLGARESATIGGMVATNAGGLQLLRYGGMRQQLVGYEAVLADGTVLRHLGGLLKDNTGYDLGGLLCGSEGTLAVLTAARLRLVPRLEHRVVALLGFGGIDAALDAAWTVRDSLPSLEALELFLGDGLELVCTHGGLARPFTEVHPVYVLVSCAASADPLDGLARVVEGLAGVGDVAVATTAERRAALWRFREGHTEAINGLGPPHKLDITLPAGELARFPDAVRAAVAAVDPAARVWLFGHVGDGNLHVNVTGPDPDDDRTDRAVLELVASLGGSISAEHGIGVAKREFLHLNRTPAELATFAAIRSALDPAGVMNPQVLFPPVRGRATSRDLREDHGGRSVDPS